MDPLHDWHTNPFPTPKPKYETDSSDLCYEITLQPGVPERCISCSIKVFHQLKLHEFKLSHKECIIKKMDFQSFAQNLLKSSVDNLFYVT